jgi:hypothetical protein
VVEDVVWDTVFGRGGQAVVAFLAYPIVRRSLHLCMEHRLVALDLWTGLTFDGFSFRSLKTLCAPRRIIGKKRVKEARLENDMIRWIRFGLVIVICYILTFSTFVSAMTGYATTFEPYFTDPNNTDALISVASLDLPPVIVPWSSELGLANWLPIYEDSVDFVTAIGCE